MNPVVPGAPYVRAQYDREWIPDGPHDTAPVVGQRIVWRPSARANPAGHVTHYPEPGQPGPITGTPPATPPNPPALNDVVDVRAGVVRQVVSSVVDESAYLASRATIHRSNWIAAHPGSTAPPVLGPFGTTVDVMVAPARLFRDRVIAATFSDAWTAAALASPPTPPAGPFLYASSEDAAWASYYQQCRFRVAEFRAAWIAAHPSEPSPPPPFSYPTDATESMDEWSRWTSWTAAHPGDQLGTIIAPFLAPTIPPARSFASSADEAAAWSSWLSTCITRATNLRTAWVLANPGRDLPPAIGPFGTANEQSAALTAWTQWRNWRRADPLGLIIVPLFNLLDAARAWGWTEWAAWSAWRAANPGDPLGTIAGPFRSLPDAAHVWGWTETTPTVRRQPPSW